MTLIPEHAPDPPTDGRPAAGDGPTSGRWHRLALGLVALVPILPVSIGWSASEEIDGVTVRLWLLLALVLAVVLLVATGFDRRYPKPSVGAVLLRGVSLAASVGLALFLVADPFVYSGVDGGSPQTTGRVLTVILVSVLAAAWYGLRSPAAPLVSASTADVAAAAGPASMPVPGTRAGSIGVTVAAVVIVAVPLVLGLLVIAVLSGLCGAGVTSLVWLAAAVATPVILAVAEWTMGQRWPRTGLAIVVGRLVLVAVAVLTILVLITVAIPGSVDCESTIGPGISPVQPAQ